MIATITLRVMVAPAEEGGRRNLRLRFKDDALRKLYEDASFNHPRFGGDVVQSYRKKMGFLAACSTIQDVRAMKSLRLEKLSGKRAGQHSIRLNDQWRAILRFERTRADGITTVVVEIIDYH